MAQRRKNIRLKTGWAAFMMVSVGLSFAVPVATSAQTANPWSAQTPPAQQAPSTVPRVWSNDNRPANRFAPENLEQTLSSGTTAAQPTQPVTATRPLAQPQIQQPQAPVGSSPVVGLPSPQYPGAIQPGYAYGYAPQTFTGFPPGYGYAPQGYAPQGYAPQGYAPQGYGATAPGYGYGGYPPSYGSGFYPGYGVGTPYGPGGYPGNTGGYWPSGSIFPGGGFPFSGSSPFGFW